MQAYLIALILGIVEGLTEFLPVSSTAHLRIAEALLNVSLSDPYWKMFTIVIQLGAILCLPIYFRAKLSEAVASLRRGIGSHRSIAAHPLVLTAVAFLATAGPAWLASRFIGRQLERLGVMGAALMVGGVVMWAIDATNARAEVLGPDVPSRIRTWSVREMSLRQAIWIGLCQVLSAVFPGTSRSMATIAAGQLAGLSRASALEFSFLLAMPTMIAAVGYDLYSASKGGGAHALGAAPADANGWAVLAVGFGVSFAVAYAAVAWLIAYVTRHGLVPFAVYRIALGAAVLASLAF